MDETLIPPVWLERAAVDDGALADAYDALDDLRLARLKGLAARLDALYEPTAARRSGVGGEVPGLLRFESEREPLDFVCLLLGGEALSPAKAMAALVPAAVLGVPRLVAAFVDAEPTDEVLAALEVSGVGEVLRVPTRRTCALVRALADEGRGLAVLSGVACPGGCVPPERVDSLPLAAPTRAAVLVRSPDDFDLEALAWAHPDMDFDVYGGRGALPSPRFKRRKGGLEALAEAGPAAVWLPEGASVPGAGLVFGPGLECSWLWPQLFRARFFALRHRWTQPPR